MKKPVFLIAFVLVTIFGFCQQSPYEYGKELKNGIGIAFTGTESMWGYSLYSEFHFYPSPIVSIAPALVSMHFREDTKEVMKTAQVESLELTFYLHLLKEEKVSFVIGGGGNLRYFHWGIAPGLMNGYEFDGQSLSPGEKGFFHQFTAGYSLTAGFSYQISPRVDLGFQEMVQNNRKSNITWDSRLSVIVKL
jgi:hypothetical protein